MAPGGGLGREKGRGGQIFPISAGHSQGTTSTNALDVPMAQQSNASSVDATTLLKNVRGRTRCLATERLFKASRSKIPVTITPEHGRPMGRNRAAFVNEIGFVVRTFAPLQAKSWRYIPSADKEALVDRILTKFDVDISAPHVIRYVHATMSSRYNDFRHDLKIHFKQFSNAEQARKNRPDTVTSQEDWDFLCSHFSSKRFQMRSFVNTNNRAKLPYNHRGGSKPFVEHQYDEDSDDCESGEPTKSREPKGQIILFHDLHYSEKKGWTSEVAQSNYYKMVDLKEKEQEQMDDSEQLIEAQICEKVLGKRSGYVKGLGYGPQPKSSSFAPVKVSDMEKEQMRSEITELRSIITQLQAFQKRVEGSAPPISSTHVDPPM